MKVAVSGASGLVGREVVKQLASAGHEVFPLVRRSSSGPSEITWDPEASTVDRSRLSQVDALIHLAGENIANKRWTSAQKNKIRSSRVDATAALVRAFEEGSGPRVFVSASAIGFYGDRADEVLTETSARGGGFLADLCADWEEAARAAEKKGVRTVNARISMVLSENGGALGKLLPIFKMGGGGPIGDGRQYMSWIDISDLASALIFLLDTDISGPVNMCAPEPVPNAEFTAVLAKVLQRPAFLPVPPVALKIAMGELADELLLCSQRVMPEVLQQRGFKFGYADLEGALRHVLHKQ